MRNKFDKYIILDKIELEKIIRKAEMKGNQQLTDAHRKILNRIAGYIDRLTTEPNPTSKKIVFILKQIIKD